MTTKIIDIKAQMIHKLKGEYLEGFNFAFEEDETQTFATLTNGAVSKIISLKNGATRMTVRYIHVKKKISSADTIYKLEVVKTGTELSFVSTEITTGRVANEIAIPALVQHESHDDHTFDTINKCIAEFDSSDSQTKLQTEANRTCENQFAHVTCCLTNGSCFSVVLIIKPASWKCWRSVALPNRGVFALVGG